MNNQNNQIEKPFIKVNKVFGSNFYYTVKGKKLAGDKYFSPQSEALITKGINHVVLCQETELKSGHTGKAYGSMSINQLDTIFTTNHHLYELLGEQRKMHLDIEFPDMGKDNKKEIMTTIFKLIISCFKDIGVKLDVEGNTVSFVRGKGETGTFKGVKKMSYHLIINNGYYFKSVEDIKHFILYCYEKAKTNDRYKVLETELGFSIDMGIYTNNRLFKLPYQSKIGSPRVHIPSGDNSRNLQVKSWLVGNYDNIEDVKFYDVSNIKLTGLGNEKTIIGRDGCKYTGTVWKMDILNEYLTYLPKNIVINKPINSIDDIVMSIYNGPAMVSYQVFMGIGMAIHRHFQGEITGLKLWKKWVDKYKDTPLSELEVIYTRFDSTRGYGYSTLKMLACQCNPQVASVNHSEKLFNLETAITQKEFNQRYVGNHNETIYNLKDNDTIYIKSPMGTGKSYELHKLFNEIDNDGKMKYPNILYLSSRRAFACSMADEFFNDGFKNYLDDDFTGYENRVIISPESLFKLYKSTFDLVIVDESESIIKIISSPTLQNEHFNNNTIGFMDIIRNANKAIVMDAFLQQRSIDAISDLRNTTQSIIWINNYQQNEKQLINYNDREKLTKQLKDSLAEGKKCVFVCGTRELGKQLYYSLQDKYNVKFYNRDNKLPNRADVNELWNNLDLLIYTPTITCGISFNLEHYDELFMYISNVNSCIPRDLIQASRRVRHFNTNKVHFCLSVNTIGLTDDNMPMEKDAITSKILNVRNAIFEPSNNLPTDKWLIDCHINNLLEEHISRRQSIQVYETLFTLENIKGFKQDKKIKVNKLSTLTQTDYASVLDIDEDDYTKLIVKNKKEGLTEEEQNTHFKYIVQKHIDDNQQEAIYNKCSTGLDYEIKQNRIKFNNIIREATKQPEDIKEVVGFSEFERMTKQQLVFLKDIKDNLKIKNYTESIDSNDLLNLKDLFNQKDYIQQLRLVFNAKIKVNQVEKAEHVKMILNNIFNEFNGCKLQKEKSKKVRIGGKVKSMTIYSIKSLFDYTFIKPEVVYDLEV